MAHLNAGGAQPRWRRAGRELLYLAPDHKLMAVEVKSGTSFQPRRSQAAVPKRKSEGWLMPGISIAIAATDNGFW
jgi:hypothetical protein